MEIERAFQCPYCLEQITMLLDPSAGSQSYIEDCEVCCRPIQLSFEGREEEITQFVAARAQ